METHVQQSTDVKLLRIRCMRQCFDNNAMEQEFHLLMLELGKLYIILLLV